MNLSDFDYALPEHLIAQEPLAGRDDSRMLAVSRARQTYRDQRFHELPDHLTVGDVLVLNNTKVFPARLAGRLETGAAIELFLIEENQDNIWTALARPGRRLKPGKRILFDNDLSSEVLEKLADGKILVRFDAERPVFDLIEQTGKTPLPPYIHRTGANVEEDRVRYQTVYASRRGAIAAPTAGLHFTPFTLDRIRERGVQIVEITLHVGYGTFEPVRVDDIADHSVMAERFQISAEAADILNSAVSGRRRIVAVGTTTTRALETSATRHGRFVAESSLADLTIRPGYKFNAVNALLTNFHLPKSSLLILVSTFGGHELIMNSYRHAVESGYRFYSYGDCMFIS
ncbi:MAG TPA: tRNA preQ1(34) S-adenosylmethionine ribosyltransferase-isomerase QueA [Pyrinomonadaceae bacterium]|nr:tRNA preQ1(34) S-adenosylmethionine ribosyltransferase-isomerase QueA [Pyrinomonadaceae bacterium]